jgi:hypothetical protein
MPAATGGPDCSDHSACKHYLGRGRPLGECQGNEGEELITWKEIPNREQTDLLRAREHQRYLVLLKVSSA